MTFISRFAVALTLALSFTACQPQVPDAATVEAALQAPTTVPVESSEGALMQAAITQSTSDLDAIPEDSADYYQQRDALVDALARGETHAFFYGHNTEEFYLDQYPYFDELEDCQVNGDRQIQCMYGRMGAPTDHEIAEHIPYLANIDVMNPDLRCTSICLTPDNRVIGAVQPAMLVWMVSNCTSNQENHWSC